MGQVGSWKYETEDSVSMSDDVIAMCNIGLEKVVFGSVFLHCQVVDEVAEHWGVVDIYGSYDEACCSTKVGHRTVHSPHYKFVSINLKPGGQFFYCHSTRSIVNFKVAVI